MQNNKVITQDLLVSISSILIFISVAYFINLNGFEKFAPFLIVVGLAMLYFSDFFTNFFKNIKIIGKPVIFTLSHIMIFIGSKVYLDKYIANYWVIYLIIGILLLNKNKDISEMFFKSEN